MSAREKIAVKAAVRLFVTELRFRIKGEDRVLSPYALTSPVPQALKAASIWCLGALSRAEWLPALYFGGFWV
jgi:hypothetical protein